MACQTDHFFFENSLVFFRVLYLTCMQGPELPAGGAPAPPLLSDTDCFVDLINVLFQRRRTRAAGRRVQIFQVHHETHTSTPAFKPVEGCCSRGCHDSGVEKSSGKSNKSNTRVTFRPSTENVLIHIPRNITGHLF